MTAKAVLVSGGSSGIGAAITSEFLARGCSVGVVSRQGRPHGADFDEQFESHGSLEWIRVDLADADATRKAVLDWAGRHAYALDGIVLAAVDYGCGPRHPLVDSSLEEWDRVHSVNLRAQFVLVSALLPALLARPRALVLSISSNAAVEAAPGRAVYAASKAGTYALFRSLAQELQDSNVSVVQVMPKNQIVTPGIRARRPKTFTFEGYDEATVFRPFAAHIALTLGAGLAGRLLAIDAEGAWSEMTQCSELHGASPQALP